VKTRAWVLVEINKLELLDIELPPLQDGQALVEIHYTSVCGSQLNEIYGRKGEDRFLPHLLGHEASLRILEVKDENSQFPTIKTCCVGIGSWINGVGRSVAVSGIRDLSNHALRINAGPITTFAQHAIISLNKIVPLDEKSPHPLHALLGCAIPTGAGSLRYAGDASRVAVVGLGGVGLSAALEAQYQGLDVTGFDPNEYKQKCAAQLGIKVSPYIQDIDTWGFIFESSGSKSAMERSFSALAPNGTLALAGNLPKGQKIEIDPFEFIRKKKCIGIVGGDCSHRDILNFGTHIENFKPLISREYNFEDLDVAIKDLVAGAIIKPIIRCLQ